MAELATLVIETARELFGYKGKVVLGKAHRRPTTWSTTRTGAAR